MNWARTQVINTWSLYGRKVISSKHSPMLLQWTCKCDGVHANHLLQAVEFDLIFDPIDWIPLFSMHLHNSYTLCYSKWMGHHNQWLLTLCEQPHNRHEITAKYKWVWTYDLPTAVEALYIGAIYTLYTLHNMWPSMRRQYLFFKWYRLLHNDVSHVILVINSVNGM